LAEKPLSVDSYIASFPANVRLILENIRTTIRQALPPSEEVISYGIPTFQVQGKSLMSYAGWKSHVSVYPLPDVAGQTEKNLAPHRSGKGTAKFMLTEPIPYDLIGTLAELLAAQRQPASP
jgi:uncharacterized protein YdhG (YjbR/CyaY superfamily)